MPDFSQYAQLGGTVIVVVCFLWFMYEQQKLKKENGNTKIVDNQRDAINNNDVLKELQMMSSNHLHSIEMAIKDGNSEIVKAINEGNFKIVEKVSELCGFLKSR